MISLASIKEDVVEPDAGAVEVREVFEMLKVEAAVGKLSLCSRTYQFSRMYPLTVSMTQPTKPLY